jgi:hypothetical protein
MILLFLGFPGCQRADRIQEKLQQLQTGGD